MYQTNYYLGRSACNKAQEGIIVLISLKYNPVFLFNTKVKKPIQLISDLKSNSTKLIIMSVLTLFYGGPASDSTRKTTS